MTVGNWFRKKNIFSKKAFTIPLKVYDEMPINYSHSLIIIEMREALYSHLEVHHNICVCCCLKLFQFNVFVVRQDI